MQVRTDAWLSYVSNKTQWGLTNDLVPQTRYFILHCLVSSPDSVIKHLDKFNLVAKTFILTHISGPGHSVRVSRQQEYDAVGLITPTIKEQKVINARGCSPPSLNLLSSRSQTGNWYHLPSGLVLLPLTFAQQPHKYIWSLKYILCDQKKMKFYFYLWEILFIAKTVFQILKIDIHMISTEFLDWNQMHSNGNDLPEIKETTKVEREMTLYILNVTTILWFLFYNFAIGFRHDLYNL